MQAKALYNLLRYNWLSDKNLEVEPWQVEDQRQLSTEELFSRLEELEVHLEEKSFLLYAENCGTPEELIECLWVKDEDTAEFDKAYLLIFELWRRFLPEKQSLSLFCDELDYRIALYDQDALEDDEPVQASLQELEDILDENVDHGEDPHRVFAAVSTYCAHDLESFLYDFVIDQIDAENDMYASELVEGFYEYVADQKWFDFLRAILFSLTNVEEAQVMLRRLLDQLQEEPDFDLLLEIADYLVHRGDISLFMQTVKQAVVLMKVEGQFQELLGAVAKFYQCCDRDAEHQAIHALVAKRAHKSSELPLERGDADIAVFIAHVSA